MATVPGYSPTPGAQAPQKYPFVGPSYKKYGEQPGFLYDPYIDKYRPDPKAKEELAKAQGTYVEPQKQPGLSDLVIPIAGIGAATAVGKGIGEYVTGAGAAGSGSAGGGLLSGAKDFFGIGGAPAVSSGPAGVAGIGPVAPGYGGIADGGMYANMVQGQNSGLMAGGEVANAAGGGVVESAPYFGSGGTLYNTNGMFGAQGSIAPLNVAGAALGTYGVYNASKMQNKRQGAMSGALSGATAGMSLGGPVGAGIGAVVGGLSGLAAHETTKHRTQRRFSDLGQSTGDAAFQQLVAQGAKESLDGKDTWDIGDDKSKAPIDLMTRSYGVLKTFGPEWSKYTPEQRAKITKALVDNDLLNSKQGDYLIDNPEKAKQIAQQAISGAPAPIVAPAQPAAQPKPVPMPHVIAPAGQKPASGGLLAGAAPTGPRPGQLPPGSKMENGILYVPQPDGTVKQFKLGA